MLAFDQIVEEIAFPNLRGKILNMGSEFSIQKALDLAIEEERIDRTLQQLDCLKRRCFIASDDLPSTFRSVPRSPAASQLAPSARRLRLLPQLPAPLTLVLRRRRRLA